LALLGCRQERAVSIARERLETRALGATPRAARRDVSAAASALRVGAWNIEHFGSPSSRQGIGHDVPQDIDRLADAVSLAGLDVVAVTEVYADERNEDGTWTSAEMDEWVFELNGRLPAGSEYGWDYLLFDNAIKSDISQLCGVLWNWNAIDSVTWWPVPVKGGKRNGKKLWDRRPHAVQFSAGPGRTDFVVVPLHMKAGTGFKAHRGVEAAQLTAKLDALRSALHDADIILIGDTNCGSPSEQAVTAFTSEGFKDLNGGSTPTVPWGQPLDQAFVADDPAENPEFVGDFVVFDGDDFAPALSQADFRKSCSDHFMVHTSVTITDDDDP
jgi:endonuclease/exonuclease/phosphatase family metal-dependent hydrolase